MRYIVLFILILNVGVFPCANGQYLYDNPNVEKDILKSVNLKPFESSESPNHLRLNIQNSILIDIYIEDSIYIGNVYYYIFQKTKLIMVNNYEKWNKYKVKKESLDKDVIQELLQKSDSILKLDSIDVPLNKYKSCFQPSPTFDLELKNSGDSTIYSHHIENSKFGRCISDFVDKYYKFYFNLPGGLYTRGNGQMYSSFVNFPYSFSGVSPEFSSRKEQNINLIDYMKPNFLMRHQNDFEVEYVYKKWDHKVCKMYLKEKL